jgi:cytochrome c553
MKIALTFTLVVLAAVSTAQAQDIKGDAAAGAKLNASCIGCHGIHGYQSSFPEVHRVPMISGQNAKYIIAALNAYKKGERKHGTMHAIAASLSDQDIANLAAYYEKHGQSMPADDDAAAAPSPAVAALLAKGACVSCHGVNFSKPIDGAYPKIAGQHADYLYVAMKSYKIEGNPMIGRSNAIMVAQMKQFSSKELRLLADYIGSLPSGLHTIPQSKFR